MEKLHPFQTKPIQRWTRYKNRFIQRRIITIIEILVYRKVVCSRPDPTLWSTSHSGQTFLGCHRRHRTVVFDGGLRCYSSASSLARRLGALLEKRQWRPRTTPPNRPNFPRWSISKGKHFYYPSLSRVHHHPGLESYPRSLDRCPRWDRSVVGSAGRTFRTTTERWWSTTRPGRLHCPCNSVATMGPLRVDTCPQSSCTRNSFHSISWTFRCVEWCSNRNWFRCALNKF